MKTIIVSLYKKGADNSVPFVGVFKDTRNKKPIYSLELIGGDNDIVAETKVVSFIQEEVRKCHRKIPVILNDEVGRVITRKQKVILFIKSGSIFSFKYVKNKLKGL